MTTASAAPYREGVYLFGGWDGSAVSKVWHYAPSTDTMTVLDGLPSAPKPAMAETPWGDLVFFGDTASGDVTTVRIFERRTETMRTVSNPDGYLFSGASRAWLGSDGQIWVWNNDNSSLNEYQDTLFRFDPLIEKLFEVGPSPHTDSQRAVVVDTAGDRVVGFGTVVSGASSGQVHSLSQTRCDLSTEVEP